MMFLICLVLGYLIGSIPTAYLFGKALKGIDIRQHGSGNIGATNVFRVLGKGPGITVLLLDIVKGIVPVVLASAIFGLTGDLQKMLVAIATVCGHNWTVFLKFRGGKGVATSLGVLIGLTLSIPSIRPVLAMTLSVWICSFIVTGFVSLASILAATSLPVFMVLTGQTFDIILMGVVFCLFIVIRHKTNISRLLKGQESRTPILPFHKSHKSS